MPVKINYSKQSDKSSTINQVLFSDEKFNTKNLRKYLLNSELNYISDLLKTSDLKKNLLVFEVNSKKKIVIVSIKKNLKTSEIENLGAEFYARVNYGKNSEYLIITDSIIRKNKNFLGHFLHGVKLKSYDFNKYKTKKESRLINITVAGNKKLDGGKIITQKSFFVNSTDNEITLQRKTQKLEYFAFPEAIIKIYRNINF